MMIATVCATSGSSPSGIGRTRASVRMRERRLMCRRSIPEPVDSHPRERQATGAGELAAYGGRRVPALRPDGALPGAPELPHGGALDAGHAPRLAVPVDEGLPDRAAVRRDAHV